VIPRCRVLFTPYGTKESHVESFAQQPALRGCAFTDDRGVCEMMVPPNVYSLWIDPPVDASFLRKTLKQVSVNSDWDRVIKLPAKE
jgi:hypothetical protein